MKRVISMALLLAACGGGSGDGSDDGADPLDEEWCRTVVWSPDRPTDYQEVCAPADVVRVQWATDTACGVDGIYVGWYDRKLSQTGHLCMADRECYSPGTVTNPPCCDALDPHGSFPRDCPAG